MVPLLVSAAILVQGLLCYFVVQWRFGRRLLAIERDLQQLSEAVSQMAELQMLGHQKLSASIGDMEERVMELALPSQDSCLPLERRHNVLALARKGVAIDDIVRRLDVPRGEAELILNLRGYMSAGVSRAARAAEEVKRHAKT